VTTVDRNRVWANGVALWEDSARKSPQKPRPHINLGHSYETKGRLSDALREYQIAAQLRQGLPDANLDIGLVYLQQGDLERARLVLQRLRETAPAFVEGWSNLGMVYVHMRQPDQALEVLNRALELKPDSHAALFARGDAFALKGEYKQAITDYRAALYQRPNAAMVRLRLGAICLRAGELAAAEEEFKVLATDPVVGPDAMRNLGIMKSDAGAYDAAIAYFERALGRRPHYAEVHHDLGIVFLRMQMPGRAIEQFQMALLQKPDFEAAVLSLSEAYAEDGRTPQARQILDQYIQKSAGRDPDYLRELLHRRDALQ